VEDRLQFRDASGYSVVMRPQRDGTMKCFHCQDGVLTPFDDEANV